MLLKLNLQTQLVKTTTTTTTTAVTWTTKTAAAVPFYLHTLQHNVGKLNNNKAYTQAFRLFLFQQFLTTEKTTTTTAT